MLVYIIRRIWQMIPTMLGVILLIFLLFNWVGEIRPISWPVKWPMLSRLKISANSSGSISLITYNCGFYPADFDL